MSKPAAHAPTLFEHADIVAAREAAREAVRAAEEGRDLAERKVKCAPHGTHKARLRAFADATHQLLQAEGRLKRLLRENGQ